MTSVVKWFEYPFTNACFVLEVLKGLHFTFTQNLQKRVVSNHCGTRQPKDAVEKGSKDHLRSQRFHIISDQLCIVRTELAVRTLQKKYRYKEVILSGQPVTTRKD